MSTFRILKKGTEEVVDEIRAEDEKQVLEDYDYSNEYYDIVKAS